MDLSGNNPANKICSSDQFKHALTKRNESEAEVGRIEFSSSNHCFNVMAFNSLTGIFKRA